MKISTAYWIFAVVIYDRPVRRIAKPVVIPTEAERKEYIKEAEQFAKSLRKEWDNPLGSRDNADNVIMSSGSNLYPKL